MARSPSTRMFPPLRTTYDDSFHGVRTARAALERGELVADPRIMELETRLESQERTMQQLLDRAVRIKQDLMENLNFTRGTWQGEKEARELLQDHVRTITAVVRQMNKEIKTLEGEIKEREQSLNDAGNAVKSLENHHVASITDLRGRVARCDGAIGKLGADLRQATESIRLTNGTHHEDNSKLNDRIQHIDSRVTEIYTRLERVAADNALNVKSTEDSVVKSIHDLDARTHQIMDDLRHQAQNINLFTTSELEKLETRVGAAMERSVNSRDVRMEKLESEHNEFSKSTNERLTTFEKDHAQYKSHVAKVHKDFEMRLNQYAENVHRQQVEDIQRLKREMRDGFGTVHDTINNMKSVLEGKQKLLEENLRREMAQIRKMVVLI